MKNSRNDKLLDFNYGLWQLLSRTRHLVFKARQKELNRYGISANYAAFLSAIDRLGKRATPTVLSQEFFMERHSASELLVKMEKHGLIKRVRDLERKNLIRAELTEKGYETYRNAIKRKSINNVISILTQEEKNQLWLILSKMRERALKQLKMPHINIYPPSDPEEL